MPEHNKGGCYSKGEERGILGISIDFYISHSLTGTNPTSPRTKKKKEGSWNFERIALSIYSLFHCFIACRLNAGTKYRETRQDKIWKPGGGHYKGGYLDHVSVYAYQITCIDTVNLTVECKRLNWKRNWFLSRLTTIPSTPLPIY